jgi:hypothetical protein
MTRGRKHKLVVMNPTGVITRTAAGVATPQMDGTTVYGRMGTPGRVDQQTSGDSAGFERIDAVCRLPRNTVVSEKSQVVCSGVGAQWDGTYKVVGIRPNELDMRVQLQRWVT